MTRKLCSRLLLCAVQTKTALSRMSREREHVSAQLTQAEQVKLVAEGDLAEVTPLQSSLMCFYVDHNHWWCEKVFTPNSCQTQRQSQDFEHGWVQPACTPLQQPCQCLGACKQHRDCHPQALALVRSDNTSQICSSLAFSYQYNADGELDYVTYSHVWHVKQ